MSRKPPRSKPPGSRSQSGSADDPSQDAERKRLRDVRRLEHAAAEQSLAAHGLLQILGSRRKLMWINFVAGLARGVGFFLGVSLLGGIFLGVTAIVFDKAAQTLGYRDVSLKQVVQAAVHKFQEIQDYVAEAQAARRQQGLGALQAPAVQGAGLRPELYRPPSSKLLLPPAPGTGSTMSRPDAEPDDG